MSSGLEYINRRINSNRDVAKIQGRRLLSGSILILLELSISLDGLNKQLFNTLQKRVKAYHRSRREGVIKDIML